MIKDMIREFEEKGGFYEGEGESNIDEKMLDELVNEIKGLLFSGKEISDIIEKHSIFIPVNSKGLGEFIAREQRKRF